MQPTPKYLLLTSLLTLPLLSACTSTHSPTFGENKTPLAQIAPASAELAPVAFMAGGWMSADAQPAKAFNEEHWMEPRGKSMVGTFRRVGAKGNQALAEITSITAEDEGVFLRLRHFHAGLEVRNNETEAQVYRLDSSADAPNPTATFAGVTNTRGVKQVTYTLADPNTLTVTIEYEPKENAPTETITMRRVRPRG